MNSDKNISGEGIIYVAATPIGNLEDMSSRLLRILAEADVVACEDTRVSMKLLELAKSRARLVSHHKFNENKTIDELLFFVESGKTLVLISDAGTPCISDPGYKLVEKAHEKGIPVRVLPGPSSVISAASVSGFDCTSFMFLGFLPRKEEELIRFLESTAEFKGAVIFLESPQRLKDTVACLREILSPGTQICLCKEMSKRHEEIHRGTLNEVWQWLEKREVLGEWVCLLDRIVFKTSLDAPKALSVEEVASYFNLPRSKASKIISLITGKSRKEIYSSSIPTLDR